MRPVILLSLGLAALVGFAAPGRAAGSEPCAARLAAATPPCVSVEPPCEAQKPAPCNR